MKERKRTKEGVRDMSLSMGNNSDTIQGSSVIVKSDLCGVVAKIIAYKGQ